MLVDEAYTHPWHPGDQSGTTNSLVGGPPAFHAQKQKDVTCPSLIHGRFAELPSSSQR